MLAVTHLVGFGAYESALNFTVTGSVTLNANQTGWGGYTIIARFGAAALSTSGSVIRLRFVPVTSGNNVTIGACYVGHAAGAGDAYDFDGTQVAVTVSGSGSFALTAGGSAVTSDNITYALDETKDLLIAMNMSATADLRRNTSTGSNYNMYFKAASADASTTNKSGYTPAANQSYVVDQIEVA